MKKTKRFTAFLLAAVLLGGCGGQGVSQEEYDKVIAERNSLEKELNEKEFEQNAEVEPNIIFDEKYLVDGEEVSIILGETNKELSLTMRGYAKDKEKAYLMFATFLAECKNIEKLLARYYVTVNMGELNITYMTTDGGYTIMGKNEDGTTVLKKPDWIPEELSELTIPESEIENYILELDSKILEFGEKSGYRMGVLIDETKENAGNNHQTQTPMIQENDQDLIYSDENIVIYYLGLSGEENNYKINLLVENLSEKTLNVSDKDTSINGYMADPLFAVTIAPGKKIIEGMSMSYSRAEDFPMSEIKNIETKFYVSNDDDWKDHYDTENVVVLNEE